MSKDLEKYGTGQTVESTEDTKTVIEYLEDEYRDMKVIDITNLLTVNSYKKFQIANYTTNVIMVAQKTDLNKAVFAPRTPPDYDSDFIVMFRGSYRTFNLDDLFQVTDSLDKMIKVRLAGEIDK